MRVLVWQDHGCPRVIHGALSTIATNVIKAISHHYDEDQIEYILKYKNEFDFELRVKFTTEDDECFEIFEFVDIQEV